MSDIINALRDIAANHGWPVCDEAADEIETLEKRYDELASSATRHLEREAQAGAVQAARLEGLHGFLLSCAVKANTFLDAATIRDWAKEIASLAATQPSAAPGDGQGAVPIGYTSPGAVKRLLEREDDSLTVDAESCAGCDVPVYLAAPGAAIATREQEGAA